MKIINSHKGINKYKLLENEYPTKFFIEKPLNFEDYPITSYKILSRYDFGVLHNFDDVATVSEFDKINIPHRFYEYQNAEVIPIIKSGDTIVMEKFFREYDCGYVYNNLEDLKCVDKKEFNFLKTII